jgi:hypothetical protein
LTFNPLTYAVKKRTPDAKLANIALAVTPRSAGSVECTTGELCLSAQNVPFCYDMISGAFHDGVGTTGNALTGDYTLGDGRKGNLVNDPYPQPTGVAAYSAASTTGVACASQTASPDSSSSADGANGGATIASTPAATGAGQSPSTEPTASDLPKANAAVKVKPVAAAVGGLMGLLGAVML